MATRATIRREVLRSLGALLYAGTATAATSTTLTDTVNLRMANTDDLVGKQIRVDGGTGIGQSRTITASDTSSKVTVPTWTTTPDTTSTYVVVDTNITTVEAVDSYIDSAVRAKQAWYLVDVIDTRLRTGDVLRGSGSFQQPFTSGVPDDFGGVTVDKSSNGTFTRETTVIDRITPQDTASCKVVSDGTNESYLEWTVPDWSRYAGLTITVKGRAYAGTTARVRLQVLDGVTTTNSDSVTTVSSWQDMSKDVTIGAAPTQLKVRAQITAGGAVTAYFQHIRLITSSLLDEMPIPQDTSANLAYLSRVDIESSTEGVFLRLPDDYWQIQHGPTPYLMLTHNIISRNDIPMDTTPTITSDRKVRLFGQESASLPTVDTDDIESLDEYVKQYALYLARVAMVPRTEKIPVWQVQVGEARATAKQMETPVMRSPNARAVRRVE